MSYSPSGMSNFNLRKCNCRIGSSHLTFSWGPLGGQEGCSCTEFPSVHVERPCLRPQFKEDSVVGASVLPHCDLEHLILPSSSLGPLPCRVRR